MGVYCFDIDGTITAHPDVFRDIMSALKKDGHTVYPLTGTVIGFNQTGEAYRIKQLKDIGIEKERDYTDVVVCVGNSPEAVGEMKGDFCRDRKVKFMVEDTDIYLNSIKNKSKETACFKIWGDR